ncbi:hypothetical protein NMY22_g6742 [Coprinellus aureogranulatus]|nr:hypothetical protein NMY22_g6742 [Coprinellus aureogranulatus]
MTIPIVKTLGGELESVIVRVKGPVNESLTATKKFEKQAVNAIQAFIFGGLKPNTHIISRAKKMRWYCPEMGALCRLLVLSSFIQRTKTTRCHSHASTDKASENNDTVPKEGGYRVTGVALPSATRIVAPKPLCEGEKYDEYMKGYSGKFAVRPDPENIPTTIGGMTEDDLLSFFPLGSDNRRYTHCGCELDVAIMDFFMWKTAPFLVSSLPGGSVECIGSPFDTRLRPTLIGLMSCMGIRPDNLDEFFKYNKLGKRNDLSNAPQFLKDFWVSYRLHGPRPKPYVEVNSPKSKSSALSRQSTMSDTLHHPNVSSTSVASSMTTTSASSFGHEHLRMNLPVSLALLVAVTALAYVTAENLVDSLEGMVHDHPNISKEWITLIIIPVISNAAEHATAVIVARKGKFDLAMSVAVGSCIQIALFVIPLLVLVAWGMGKPLMLLFDPLETIILFFSVLVVKFSIEDGRSHWMSGMALIAVYIMIALSFWNFPDPTRLIQGVPLVCN